MKQNPFLLFFKAGDIIITDKVNMVKKFNLFFTIIGTNLSNKINLPNNESFKDYLKIIYKLKFIFTVL